MGRTNITPSLWGKHQMYNAVLAIIALLRIKERGYVLKRKYIKYGLEHAIWRGRLDILSTNPLIIVDGAPL